MKHKVIFDTNSIRNAESVSDFLGGRSELEKFLNLADIIVPEIVIDEIKNQKRKNLITKRNSFISNPFHLLRKIDVNETKEFDIEKWVLDLAESEKIPYTIITLTRNVLEDIKKLCLHNLPPFEENSDKGFKDAYIYFTILEFLETVENENTFFVTKDNRLKEAFKGNTKLKVVKDYEEFEKHIDNYFKADYFISRLNEQISDKITKENIVASWLNSYDNWIIKIQTEDTTYFVEVDFFSREILDFTDEDFSHDINGLINSPNFATTHSRIAALENYAKYFSNKEIENILEAADSNSQILGIEGDYDVHDFLTKLRNTCKV